MRFILANDDGVEAVGIKTIANSLKRSGHDVTVVAPFANRSGFSHSLSVRKNMGFKKNVGGYDDGIKVYALDGTPADCIKFAVHHFGKDSFDVVISGINNGSNISYDTMYSGTVGAAMEGGLQGLPSFALSVGIADKAECFETCAEVFLEIFPKLYEKYDKSFIYNINCPDLEKSRIKGVKMTKLGSISYDESYTPVEIEGKEGFVLKGNLNREQTTDLTTDVGAFFGGYVSVTPLSVDRTCYSALEELQ